MATVIEHGSWSFSGGEPRPAYVVLLKGRVWGCYCYRPQALAVAARLSGNERSPGPTLAEYTAWQP